MINKKNSIITIFLTFILLANTLYSQNKNIDLYGGFGLGYIEGNIGTNLELESGYSFKKLRVSLYFNSMSSIEEINPVGEYSISIIDEIPDIIYTDLFRSSDVRSQTSFGPQIEYQALNLNRFSLGIGIGVNYNIYFRKVFRESGLNNSLSYSYVSRHQKGIGKLGYLNFDYSLKENIGIEFKFRVTEFVDYNVGFSIGLKLKV